jgi:hypothetical protein
MWAMSQLRKKYFDLKSNLLQDFVSHQKSKPMKILKITILSLLIVLVGLLGYANLRRLSRAEKLKQVQLVSFNLEGEISSKDKTSLEKSVSSAPGISACSIGNKGDVASVIYYPDKINASIIARLLSDGGRIIVTHKDLSTSGGCPVHKIGASLDHLMAVLDFRKF